MITGIVEGSGGKILVTTSDDFNRANSSNITASGKNWQEIKGEWEISSNKLQSANDASGNAIAILKINNKNAKVKVDGPIYGSQGSGDGWGVSFWVVDQDNWWSATTNMTQSSVQNPGFTGTTNVFIGNQCGGSAGGNPFPGGGGFVQGPFYNGDSSWPPYAGTCYSTCATSVVELVPGTAPTDNSCPGSYFFMPGYCGNVGGATGGCLFIEYFFLVNAVLNGNLPGPNVEQYCPGGVTCCTNPIQGNPGTSPVYGGANYQLCNCCLANGVTDHGCPGSCQGGTGPVPQYQQQNVNYPETRTWTYVMSTPIRKSVNGVVTTVSTPSVSYSQTVGAGDGPSYPTRPTSIEVTTSGENISVIAPGSAGGTISATINTPGANRGKKHGVANTLASVATANCLDNFVYTQQPKTP